MLDIALKIVAGFLILKKRTSKYTQAPNILDELQKDYMFFLNEKWHPLRILS